LYILKIFKRLFKRDFVDFIKYFLSIFLVNPFHTRMVYRFVYLNTSDFPVKTPVIKAMLCWESLWHLYVRFTPEHYSVVICSTFLIILNSYVEAFCHLLVVKGSVYHLINMGGKKNKSLVSYLSLNVTARKQSFVF
jgi:hypothetical protein